VGSISGGYKRNKHFGSVEILIRIIAEIEVALSIL
jgi:hypothetical protein